MQTVEPARVERERTLISSAVAAKIAEQARQFTESFNANPEIRERLRAYLEGIEGIRAIRQAATRKDGSGS